MTDGAPRLDGKKVLVTGAGGFIGSHLTELLVARGARVRAFVRYNSRNDPGMLAYTDPEVLAEVEIVPGDLRDPESVTRAAADREYIFHLGAQIAIPYSYVNPRDFVETNVVGTLNVAQAAISAGTSRLIQVSTSEVYGSAQTIPISESHPLEAQSPYAATKIGADKLIDGFHRSFSLPATIVRPFNTYGPRQSTRAVIPQIITQLGTGARVIKLGALDPARDFSYVTDTVAAFISVGTAPGSAVLGEVFNCGPGDDVSIGDLAAEIVSLMGVRADIVADAQRLRPKESEVMRLVCDAGKLRERTGWLPRVSRAEGLRATIEWFAEPANLARYTLDEYHV
jgi:NDP-hexose 4,6-dehydratase